MCATNCCRKTKHGTQATAEPGSVPEGASSSLTFPDGSRAPMIRNSEMKPVGSFFFPRVIVPITIFFSGVCVGGGKRKRGRREKVSEV